MRKENGKEKKRLLVSHRDILKETAAVISHLIIFARFASFRYLQADADRQEIWVISELDGDTCDAFSITANRESEVEPRAIHTASRGIAGYAKQH